MDWSVSTVRTSAGWQVSVSRPDLLDGLYQAHQVGTRLRSLMDSDQATAVRSGLTLTTDQTADDAGLNLMVAWMVPDPAIQVPVRLDGLTIQQTEQQAGLNGHQQACVGSPDTGQAQTGLTGQAGHFWPVSDAYRPGRYDGNGLDGRQVLVVQQTGKRSR